MATKLSFRAAALVNSPATIVRSDSETYTLDGDVVARPAFVVGAATLAGVSSFASGNGESVPAALGYDIDRDVFAFARAESDNAANAVALAAIVKSYAVEVFDAQAASVKFVQPADAEPQIPVQGLLVELRYRRKSGKAYQTGDPLDNALMGRLVLTGTITPRAGSLLMGDIRSHLIPSRNDVFDIGSGGNNGRQLRAVYAGNIHADDVVIGGGRLSATPDAAGKYGMPNSNPQNGGKRLATADEIAATGRSDAGGRNVRDFAGEVIVGGYPLVGGEYGDLINIVEHGGSGGTVSLFASNYDFFQFLRDGGSRAWATGLIGTNGALAQVGNSAVRNAGSPTLIHTSTSPSGIGIHPCRMTNVGSGYMLRFGTAEGGAVDAAIDSVEKLRGVLAMAQNVGYDNAAPPIGGLSVAPIGVFGNLCVWGDVVRGGVVQPKNNMSAASNPGVSNDVSEGYARGSLWMENNGTVWICESNATDAAEWQVFRLGRGLTGVTLWDEAATNVGTVTLTTGTFATGSNNLIFEGDPGGDVSVPHADFDTNGDTVTIITSVAGSNTSATGPEYSNGDSPQKISEGSPGTTGRVKTRTLTITRKSATTATLSVGPVVLGGGNGNIPAMDPPAPRLTKILAN